LKNRKEAERNQTRRGKNRDYRRGAVGPLKTEGNVHKDAHQRRQGLRQSPLFAQLGAGNRAHRIRPYDFIGIFFRPRIDSDLLHDISAKVYLGFVIVESPPAPSSGSFISTVSGLSVTGWMIASLAPTLASAIANWLPLTGVV